MILHTAHSIETTLSILTAKMITLQSTFSLVHHYTINHLGKSSLGLAVYFFIFGNLINASVIRVGRYLMQNVSLWFYGPSFFSKTSGSPFYIRWLHRAMVFHFLWHRQHHWYSHTGSLGLIFIHHDAFDQPFLLMPWTYGSKSMSMPLVSWACWSLTLPCSMSSRWPQSSLFAFRLHATPDINALERQLLVTYDFLLANCFQTLIQPCPMTWKCMFRVFCKDHWITLSQQPLSHLQGSNAKTRTHP